MVLRLNPDLALDASRMATMFALRRDWAPSPQTQPWQPEMQYELAIVAEELRAEAIMLQGFALST